MLEAGCLSNDTLVKVRADGSGTVEQTLMVNPETFEGFAAMAGGQKDGGDVNVKMNFPSPKDMLDEAKLKEAAAQIGPGVRFVSATPLKEGKMEGARAIFAFDDINKISVTGGGASGGPSNDPPMTFHMERRPGGTSLLTINLPDPADKSKAEPAAAAPPSPMPPQMLAMLKPLFADMRVAIALEVEGGVVKTNATHVSGSRITLLNIDFGALMNAPGAFEKLTSLGPGASMTEVAPIIKDIPGLQVQTTPTLSVEFK